ncbi:MAG TPA: FecR domain-containing protein [Opitutaceae bacterium]|jgi:transmembrane sensor
MIKPERISDPEADDAASLWAARLEGGRLTPAERAELGAWLSGDASRREALGAYCAFSARLDGALAELVDSGAVLPPAGAPRRASWVPWSLAGGGLAAAAALAVVLVAGRSGREDLSTPVGKLGSFTLSDGSRVELNANTSISVENGRSERRVRLSGGEAFFVVSKDKSRPFIVDTPAGSVRVTGTIFNVLSEDSSQLDVTVVEGSVHVSLSGSRGGQGGADLAAGGVLTSEGGRVTVSSDTPAEVDDALAWRQGRIVCNAMPVSEAIGRFAHYHGITMTATPGAGAMRAGGQYSLGNLADFEDYLSQSLHLRVERSPDGSVRVSLPGGS